MRNVPKLRFKEFSGEWEEKKLGEFVTIKSGESPANLLDNEGTIPYFKVEQLNNSTKYQQKTPYKIKYNKNKIIKKGSIIFPKRGAAILLNKIRIISQDSYMDTNLMSLTTNNINNEFLYYIILKNDLSKIADTTSIPQINNKHIEPFLINVTLLLNEQQKIADFLSSVDKRISIAEEKLDLFKDYKKGIMQKIFNQELRFKDSEGNNYPEWKKIKLKDILIERKERNTENLYQEVFSVAKEQGIVNQIEHLGRSFASKDISNYRIVMPNDIVYTKSPLSEYPYGIVKQNLLNRIGVVSVLYGVFTPINKITGLFIHYYFLCPNILNNYLSPIINKGAKNTINISNDTFLNGSYIMLPTSLEEQEKIANFLSSIDNKIDNLTAELENLKEFKKGLLQQMFV